MDLPSLDNRVGGLGCAPNVAEKRDAPLFGCFRNLHSTMSRAAAIGLPPFFFRLQPSAVNRCVLAPRIFLIEGFHRSGGGCGLEFPGRLGLDPKRRYGPGLFVLGSGSRHGGRDNEVSLKQKKKLGAALENGKDQSFSSCPSITIDNQFSVQPGGQNFHGDGSDGWRAFPTSLRGATYFCRRGFRAFIFMSRSRTRCLIGRNTGRQQAVPRRPLDPRPRPRPRGNSPVHL